MEQFVWEFIKGLTPLWLLMGIALLFVLVHWLFTNRDRFRHPEEYRDKGSTGEQLVYLALKKYGVTNQQFLRNVYIPTAKGTTEIDLIVLSKKGVLIFECKNYSGNIYGDGKRKKWIQYLGRAKNYFPNPILQNRYHVQQLSNYLQIPNLPIIPFVATTTNGKWKVKNIPPDNYFLDHSGSLIKIYRTIPDSEVMAQNFRQIQRSLAPLARPDESVRQAHIDQLKQRHP